MDTFQYKMTNLGLVGCIRGFSWAVEGNGYRAGMKAPPSGVAPKLDPILIALATLCHTYGGRMPFIYRIVDDESLWAACPT